MYIIVHLLLEPSFADVEVDLNVKIRPVLRAIYQAFPTCTTDTDNRKRMNHLTSY